MSVTKTILVAHRTAAVRDRIAAALADARHDYVTADSTEAALEAAASTTRPISLALVDLGMGSAATASGAGDDALAFVTALRQRSSRPVPIVIFAGTVRSGADIPALLASGVAGYVNEHAATAQILPALAPHLFPDSFDRRSSPRVMLGIPVSYRAGATIAGALTLNVGKGGLAIRTMSPLAAGTDVQLKFRLPSSATDFDIEGRVAWSNRQVGMGIQFGRIDSAAQTAIDGFVDAHS
jgi:uncharacterized protein (TIGR02266 family)